MRSDLKFLETHISSSMCALLEKRDIWRVRVLILPRRLKCSPTSILFRQSDAIRSEVLRNAYFIEHVRTLREAGYLAGTSVDIATAPEVLTYLNLVQAKRCDPI